MIRFAAPGDVYLYQESEETGRKVKARQILWGDWLNVVEEVDSDWARVKWGKQHYFVKQDDLRTVRPMEVIFLDVGQGDSCVLTTAAHGPDERIMVVDAGAGANTYKFLKWRFGKFKQAFRFHAAIITHPDKDHYNGFQRLFAEENVSFERVYHNGIAERPGSDRLGPSDASGDYLTDIIDTHQQMADLYRLKAQRGKMLYPKLMHTALKSGRVGEIRLLSDRLGDIETFDHRAWIKGFSPQDDPDFSIEVLGPVIEPDGNGKPRLRWFGRVPDDDAHDEGKTKNGHSVLLRLRYREFSLLFGGDLNRPAETFLLRHYGNDGHKPSTPARVKQMVEKAGKRFGADVMKCCHHGASDVTDEFLEAVHPFAFVVSSGDEESHVHPRPDLLGRLGKKGRSAAPLLLCTELLRSTRESEPASLRSKLNRINDDLEDALQVNTGGMSAEQKEAHEKAIKELRAERNAVHRELFKRNVGVYGAITLRTDGDEVLIAFRREKPKGKKRWQTYRYEMKENGFELITEDGH